MATKRLRKFGLDEVGEIIALGWFRHDSADSDVAGTDLIDWKMVGYWYSFWVSERRLKCRTSGNGFIHKTADTTRHWETGSDNSPNSRQGTMHNGVKLF